MNNNMIPEWLRKLEDDECSFMKRFVLASGSLKEIASQYGVTYPTVRLKLDRLIQKIEIHDKDDSDSYIMLIKRLATDDQIDFAAAKLLIEEYKKTSGGK